MKANTTAIKKMLLSKPFTASARRFAASAPDVASKALGYIGGLFTQPFKTAYAVIKGKQDLGRFLNATKTTSGPVHRFAHRIARAIGLPKNKVPGVYHARLPTGVGGAYDPIHHKILLPSKPGAGVTVHELQHAKDRWLVRAGLVMQPLTSVSLGAFGLTGNPMFLIPAAAGAAPLGIAEARAYAKYRTTPGEIRNAVRMVSEMFKGRSFLRPSLQAAKRHDLAARITGTIGSTALGLGGLSPIAYLTTGGALREALGLGRKREPKAKKTGSQ